jgi:hypothetical protein
VGAAPQIKRGSGELSGDMLKNVFLLAIMRCTVANGMGYAKRSDEAVLA